MCRWQVEEDTSNIDKTTNSDTAACTSASAAAGSYLPALCVDQAGTNSFLMRPKLLFHLLISCSGTFFVCWCRSPPAGCPDFFPAGKEEDLEGDHHPGTAFNFNKWADYQIKRLFDYTWMYRTAHTAIINLLLLHHWQRN